MPEISVQCRAQYLVGDVDYMRTSDYSSTNIVKAVKGLSLHPKAYTEIQVDNTEVQIRDDNKDMAIQWFAEWAAPLVDSLGSQDKVVIPIPASTVTRNSSGNFRTAIIADAILGKCETSVTLSSAIRWRRAKPSTKNGGTRNAKLLYDNMVVSGTLPPGDVILIDDVYTSGGHLKAAAWRFADRGRTILGAICCGRTCRQQLADPLQVEKEFIDISRLDH